MPRPKGCTGVKAGIFSLRDGGPGRNPRNGMLLWLVISLLFTSMLMVTPVYLPGSLGAAYGGHEPTPTNLTVFLHNSSVSLPITGGITSPTVATTVNDTASQWKGTGQMLTGLHYLNAPSFYLFPRLAGPLDLNGTPTADIFVNQTGSVSSGQWTFDLYAVDASGVSTLLGSGSSTYSSGYNVAGTGYPLRISLSGPPVKTNLSAGESLYASFSQTQGNSKDGYGFWWGDVGGTYFTASVNLPASTYLTVNPAYLVGPDGLPTSSLNLSAKTTAASLRANMTDPLGNYDYTNWSVNWVVTNGTGATVGSGLLSPVGPSVPPLFYGPNETYAAPWNYSGLQAGQYTLCVNATDNTYHNDLLFAGNYYGRAASDCFAFFIGSAPHRVTLHVLDSEHTPLSGAVVSGLGEMNRTDPTGTTHLNLPNGSITVTVKWESIVVSVSSIDVSGPTQATVLTTVYDPTISIEDAAGGPLSDAMIYLVHPNGSQYPLLRTPGSGNLSLTQVPGGTFSITVIWHDSVVYSQRNPSQPPIDVAGNVSYPVVTAVFYQSFQVVQPTGTPIPLASVVVQNSTTGVLVSFSITNATGVTTSEVPAGYFDVMVYWQTSVIASVSGLALPTDKSPYVIKAALYAVTFQAVDSAGSPVSGAVVTVSGTGGSITSLVTGDSGNASMILPGGTYGVITAWEGVVVNATSVTIAGSTTMTLHLAVYYLTVVTEDNTGAGLSGVFLQVKASATGNYVGSATSSTQPTVFRIPKGEYTIVASYDGIYDLTKVSQTLIWGVALSSSSTVVLRFSDVNPSFTSTGEFLVLVALVGLVAVLIILLALLGKRRKEGPRRVMAATSSVPSETSRAGEIPKAPEDSQAPPTPAQVEAEPTKETLSEAEGGRAAPPEPGGRAEVNPEEKTEGKG